MSLAPTDRTGEGTTHLKEMVMTPRLRSSSCLLVIVAFASVYWATSFAQKSEEKKAAQSAPAGSVREWPADHIGGLIVEWTQARAHTREYLNWMPEDGIHFKPVAGGKSFAEGLLHLADTNFSFGLSRH